MHECQALLRYLVLVLLAFSASPSLRAGDPVPTHHFRGTPTVDGIETPGEWTGADVGVFNGVLPFGFGGGAFQTTLYIMNDELKIYVAGRYPLAASPPAPGFATLLVYAWMDGLDPCAGETVRDDFGVSSQKSNAYVFDNYFDSGCLNLLVDTDDAGDSNSEGTWAISSNSHFFELSQPLAAGDVLHDINQSAPGLLRLSVLVGGCAAQKDCGFAAGFLDRRVFLVSEGTILFADFEGGDFNEWTNPFP